jgi:hypothetical protein
MSVLGDGASVVLTRCDGIHKISALQLFSMRNNETYQPKYLDYFITLKRPKNNYRR